MTIGSVWRGVVLAGLLTLPVWSLMVRAEPTTPAEPPASANQAASQPGSQTDSQTDTDANPDGEQAVKPAKELFRGRVVLITDALQKRGVKAYSEELKGQVALETAAGDLLPILPDWRGRAFYQDERLRDRKVDLIGFRRPGLPWVQVLTIYTFDAQNQRQYTDYWCDICSIPMYEIKACDCCQQDIRLRFQPQELPADLVSASPR